MKLRSILSLAVTVTWLSQAATAAPKATPCDGYFVTGQQGFRIGPDGTSLLPSGPMVAEGTTLKFSAMRRIGGTAVLSQAKSPIVFDAQNIDIQHGCLLPDR